MEKILQLVTCCGAALLFAGCSGSELPRFDEPYTEMPPINYLQADRGGAGGGGSLWAGNDDHWSLFADDRARRPGDVIFINIVDRSEGASNTEGDVDRKMDIVAGISNLFGQEANYGTGVDASGDDANIDLDQLIKANSDLKFESEGELKRDHKVLAQISAQVVDLTPTGNLVIHGYKVTKVGKENNYLTISGIVRPSDLNFENAVDSTRIANARVDYGVKGPFTGDIQSPGWLARVFNLVWPF